MTKDEGRVWWRWVTMVLIVLIAFALRVYRLDAVSLRGDEAFTVVFVQRTWEGLWRGISTIEPNPPLMYLVLRVWVALAGDSEFATRYFSVFFGVLCVPLLYRLTRTMWTTRDARGIALFASVLIAINPYQIWHSQDVRNYTMWPCLSLLALVFLWRWWRLETRDWRLSCSSSVPSGLSPSGRSLRPSSSVLLSLYVLAALASLYTHYYETFILTAVNVFVFTVALWARRLQALTRWIGAQVVLIVLYVPWVLFGTDRITNYEATGESAVSLLDVFRRTFTSFVLGDTVSDEFQAMLWLPLVFALMTIWLLVWRQQRTLAAFVFLWIAIPTFALYLVSMGRPLFSERYLNGIASAYYLIFAVGLWWVGKFQVSGFRFEVQDLRNKQYAITYYVSRIAYHVSRLTPHISLSHSFALSRVRALAPRLASLIGLALFIALAAYALGNYYFDPAYAKAPNWRALMQYIKDHYAPGDLIIQNFTEMSPYYYRSNQVQVITVPRTFWARPIDERNLRQFSQDYRRLWFIPASPGRWDPDRFVETFLSHHTERIAEIPIDIFRLQLYWTPREFLPKMARLDARIGAAKLVGYRVQGARNLHVALYWQTETRIEKSWTVFTHVLDANARVVAQHDGIPSFGRYPTTAWRPGELVVDVHAIRVDAPPGTYTLVVGMYDAESRVRAPAFDPSGARAPNDQILLTTITIP
ncbi:MAG: glycosyltransferase family 39 protein [Anaerolineae bacterium]|nr:glycosyltransferase family 39 protein [Anaerolineae bacterium]